MRNNDDDIKIFHPKKKDGIASDLTSLAGIMDKHRANGNISKAGMLGEHLADMTPETICPDEAKKLSNNELTQLRALMVFSAQIALHKYLPNTMLSTQSVNAMYAKIEQTSPGFFANISDGSSFSFYYLSVRKGENTEEEIGRNYAMLCDRDDNEFLIALGKEIYGKVEAKVMDLIENFCFEY